MSNERTVFEIGYDYGFRFGHHRGYRRAYRDRQSFYETLDISVPYTPPEAQFDDEEEIPTREFWEGARMGYTDGKAVGVDFGYAACCEAIYRR